jgi:hypothetical protein
LRGCICVGDAHKDINADGQLDVIHSGDTITAFEKESFFAMEICIPALKEKPKLKTNNLQKVTEIKHTYRIPTYKDNENSKIILTRKIELETIERFK